MSDVMLLGVLRMPVDRADETGFVQFVQRAREAADRIEELTDRVAGLEKVLGRIDGVGERPRAIGEIVHDYNLLRVKWYKQPKYGQHQPGDKVYIGSPGPIEWAPEAWRSELERALGLARVFDDGSDGADGESAAGVVSILSRLLDRETSHRSK